MTQKRFEDIELLILDGYIQDNYDDEKISNPAKIIKTLNELHEKNEAYKLRGLTEDKYHQRYEKILKISGELIDEYEEKLDSTNIEDNLRYYMSLSGSIDALKRLQARILNEI